MLESIHIQNFKGFKNTQIGPFRKVNLIIGGQNVGKTSLLEAVYASVALSPYDALSVFRQNEGNDKARHTKSASHPEFLINTQFDDGTGLLIATKNLRSFKISIGEEVTFRGLSELMMNSSVSFRAWNTGSGKRHKPLPCKAIPYSLPSQIQLVELFGRVILSRKKKELMNLLKKVDERLASLDAIAPDGEQRIYAELEGSPQALPINMLGHGFSRLVYLFSELLASDAKIALIDEIENGIHYSALPTLFEGIKAVAQERQVQSLITTHSWDCLRAACEVFEDTPDMFQVIRLERHGDDVKAVCIDGERMLRLMAEEREVR